jgi:hypothetical protein
MGIEPMDDALMQQSCRVALAEYLHDLGKFAERVGGLRIGISGGAHHECVRSRPLADAR